MAKQEEERPLHELLPPVEFTAMGAQDEQKNQGNLITARQSEAFPIAGGLISHCLTKHGERIMLDYTAAAVAVKFDIDGLWMNVDPRDRQTGDAMLAVFKKIANLNPQDRRSRQDGSFGAVFHGAKYICEVSTQGVTTGERILIKITPKKAKFEAITELGMRDGMRAQFKQLIDKEQGFVVFSTPPSNGLTTLWNIGLETADRFVRDFVSMEDKNKPEAELINIGPILYDSTASETPATILPKLLLKQPDVFVVPNLTDGETVTKLCEQVTKNHKMVITRVHARDAVESLLRVMQYKGSVEDFANSATMALNCRLIRKLCEKCKQPFQPAPQLLQKLGIPPGRVNVLYREFQPPPPEQQVDEKGRPIELEVCSACHGVGYKGRTAVFELLEVNDQIRQALVNQPNADAIRRVAKAAGHRSLQEEGILLVAQGITSLPELQRVLK